MDGVHDMGGMHGFGSVPVNDQGRPFPEPSEGRVFATNLALTVALGANVDRFRFLTESMPPLAYLSSSYYERWLADRRKDETEAPRRQSSTAQEASASNHSDTGVATGVGESADDRKARKRAEAALRQKLSPYRKRQTGLEKEMDDLQQTLKVLEDDLADPSLYAADGKARLQELLGKQAEARGRLETVEAEWLDVSETVESMEAELAG